MNDRNVSLAPLRSNSAFLASRICATREKLTSNTECTCADVRRLATMCSAIRLRIGDIFSTRSPAPDAPACLADAALEVEAAKAGLAAAAPAAKVGPAEAASVRGA